MKTVSRTCCCIACHKEYSYKGIHTHYERAHGSPVQKSKYSSGYNNKYNDADYLKNLSAGIKSHFVHTLGEFTKFTVNCHKCGTGMYVTERASQFPTKYKYFCSRSCANTRIQTAQTKAKIGHALRSTVCKVMFVTCVGCNGLFCASRARKYCTKQCQAAYVYSLKTQKKQYRYDCRFQFNLKDFPTKFDFGLIETYGWYSATNKGNNIGGVSRDHMISLDYGWKNNVPPEIISHPANCQLMRQTVNLSKRTTCSIQLDELHDRIKKWNNC